MQHKTNKKEGLAGLDEVMHNKTGRCDPDVPEEDDPQHFLFSHFVVISWSVTTRCCFQGVRLLQSLSSQSSAVHCSHQTSTLFPWDYEFHFLGER